MKTFEERLDTESAAWVADGLIAAEQRARLIARHPVRAGGAQRFLAILLMIGAALFAVGVSLVIKSNWAAIGDWVKIGGLIALLAGTYVLGWRLKESPGNFPRMGDACFMAAAVFFLLGIALVSQIFHINSRPANGVLLWWVGIVALPWLTRAKGMQMVSVVAGLTLLPYRRQFMVVDRYYLRELGVDVSAASNSDSMDLVALYGSATWLAMCCSRLRAPEQTWTVAPHPVGG